MNNDESFISMTVEGIINKVLADGKCNGLCIDPDTNIDSNNFEKQCIILKEHILKILQY